MKTMTCKQLGGACDQKFYANTFEEIAEMRKQHGMEMIRTGDLGHIDAMNKMQAMMESPGKMARWMEDKRKEFDALPESNK